MNSPIQSAGRRFLQKFGVAFLWATVISLVLGSMAYFRVAARHIKAEAAAEEEVLASEDEQASVGARPNLVASFPPHVQLRLGDEVPVAVDTKNLHFFDEASGAPLR